MQSQTVEDKLLGSIIFPATDQVMAPYIRENGFWEEVEILWLQKNVQPGDRCVNVGANVGYFAKLMLRLVGESGTVTAVEPNPHLIPFLRTNLQAEKNQNYRIIQKAAGRNNKDESIELFLNEKNYGDNRVFDPRIEKQSHDHTWHGFDAEPKSVSVSIVSMDTILRGQRVDVVLIDAQGWDFFVLQGMRGLIKKYRPKVLFEFTPDWMLSLGLDPLDVLKTCESWGYNLACEDLGLAERVDPETLFSTFLSHKHLDHVNVYLQPKFRMSHRIRQATKNAYDSLQRP